MVDPSAIATLEQTAANLGRLLCGWSEARAAETETNPQDLTTISSAINSLWRLTAIHKSFEQLKNSGETHYRYRPISSPRSDQSDRSAPSTPSPPQPPLTPVVHEVAVLPASPSVPCVPVVPTLGSIEAIAAKTDQLFTEISTLLEANGLPVPDESVTPDQFGLNFLDAITGRAAYPGSGKLAALACPP